MSHAETQPPIEPVHFSPLIQKAINFALKVHHVDHHHTRKGENALPYIEHVLSVALILSFVTSDKEVIVAGIIHDTAEDSVPPHKVTLADLEQEFGHRVAQLVDQVTEKDKAKSWKDRKQQTIDHVHLMDDDALLLKTADFLQNLTETVADVNARGDQAFAKFNAPKEDQLWYFSELFATLKFAWSQNPLLEDLQATLQQLLALC